MPSDAIRSAFREKIRRKSQFRKSQKKSEGRQKHKVQKIVQEVCNTARNKRICFFKLDLKGAVAGSTVQYGKKT